MKIAAYLRPTPDKEGKFPIVIRITENRLTSFRSIGYSIQERFWNKPKNELRTSCPDYEKINKLINDKINEIKQEWRFRANRASHFAASRAVYSALNWAAYSAAKWAA